MTQREPKLIFDANIGKPLVVEIRAIMEWSEEDERAKVLHVFEFQESLGLGEEGVWDQVWVPEAAKHGWAIVASDKGSKGGTKKGQKLPILCRDYGIVHFILSKGVHHRRKFKKLLTLLSVWHELIHLSQTSEGGTKFAIEPASNAPFSLGRGRIIHKPAPPGAPPPKGLLFD